MIKIKRILIFNIIKKKVSPADFEVLAANFNRIDTLKVDFYFLLFSNY